MNSDNTINHWMITSKISGESAESLWEDAKDYFMWCEANPIFKDEMIKQTGDVVNVRYPRPFNLAALCIHCGVTVSYINSMARNQAAGDYYYVAQKILQVIYSQNLEYAMVGIFNANMTARKLNLGVGDDESKAPAIINISVIENGAPPLLENEQGAK
jgi:DNA-packaging protein gp3